MLKSQMEVLKDLEDETNPFLLSISVTDSDIEEARNESEDELIELEGF